VIVARRSIRGAAVAGVLLLTGLSVPRLGRAAPQATILVLLEGKLFSPLLLSELDSGMRAEVAEALGAELRQLPKPALDFDQIKVAAGCADDGPECIAMIGKTLGAGKVFQGALGGTVEHARIGFIYLDVSTGRSRVLMKELDDLSSDSVPEFRALVSEALGKKRSLPAGSLQLLVTGKIGGLEGAELLLDDHRIEAGEMSSIAPGRHKVEVRQKGFEPFVWNGPVRPGKPTRVPIEFEPTPLALAPSPVALATGGSPPPKLGADPTPPIETAAASPAAATVEASPEPAPSRTPWFTLSFGGAALAAGVVGLVEGLEVQSSEHRLHDYCADPATSANCAGPNDPPSAREKVCDFQKQECDAGRRAALISSVAWVAAGGFAGATLLSYILESKAPSAPPAALAADRGVKFGLVPGPGGLAASVGWAF
jgi:hypothetical protein